LSQRRQKPFEEVFMREAEPERNVAAIIVAVLAIAGASSFAFAGITMFEKFMVTATSVPASAVNRS
jgi:hypothetical protein